MARTARASVGGICYHVLNRGNPGKRVFRSQGDLKAFLQLIGEAGIRVPMRVLAFCILPTHFHLILWPYQNTELSAWMQWLLTAHVRRHHRTYGTHGHVWVGRFRAFPIQQDHHILQVYRYVEQNPVRLDLVNRAEDWLWTSVHHRLQGGPFVQEGPLPLKRGWSRWVNQPIPHDELSRLRQSVNRGTPYGSPAWVTRIAKRLGLESSIRPRGRPRKRSTF